MELYSTHHNTTHFITFISDLNKWDTLPKTRKVHSNLEHHKFFLFFWDTYIHKNIHNWSLQLFGQAY